MRLHPPESAAIQIGKDSYELGGPLDRRRSLRQWAVHQTAFAARQPVESVVDLNDRARMQYWQLGCQTQPVGIPIRLAAVPR